MQLTPEQFAACTRCQPTVAAVWVSHINPQLTRWKIDTPARVAGFLAQMSHESARFTRFIEVLNYSAEGLANTWPGRYSVNPNAVVKVPNDLAESIARNPEAIANHTYANRMGNGDVASGDGWRYRGRGPKQITGLENYTRLSKDVGVGFVNNPDWLLQPRYGALSAAWYWDWKQCNQLQDAGDFKAVTKAINGGLIGYDQRLELLENAKRVLEVV
jgi:putative chitinase